MSERYTLKCKECHRDWGNQPRSFCEDCMAPLEVAYDLDAIRPLISREKIAARPVNIWRFAELLPLPEGFECEPSWSDAADPHAQAGRKNRFATSVREKRFGMLSRRFRLRTA